MKKLFLIISILLAFVSADVFSDLINGQNAINPAKKYYGGIDQDEITYKYLFVQEAFITNTSDLMNEDFAGVAYSNYTITLGKTFIPLFLRVTKYSVTTDWVGTLYLKEVYWGGSTNSTTNTIAELIIPKGGEVTYGFNYPISVSQPTSQSTTKLTNSLHFFFTRAATNFTGSLAAQLYGIEIDN